MKPVSLAKVAEAIGASLASGDPDALASGASIDSRTIREGDLFFALKGQTDGAEFAADAHEKGAVAAVADRPLDVPTLVVGDVLGAMQTLARWNLVREDAEPPAIVGITGTVGKTTTKDALAAILRHAGRKVSATAGNFNNEIGLPLTVLSADPKTEILVLEMGATHAGDIAALCDIASPRVGILTAISPVHLDSFETLEALAEAKGELAVCLPDDGSLVFPVNAPTTATGSDRSLSRRISFGSNGADLWPSEVEETEEGIRFTANMGGESVEVRTPVFGTHLVQPILAAMGGGVSLGLGLEECAAGVARLKRTGLRGELYRLRDGIIVYDDSYNASPAAVSAVLRYGAGQASQQGKRLVAVLGGMFELGPNARAYHREAGEQAAEAGVDLLVCVGEEARWYAEAFSGETLFFEDADSAAEGLHESLAPGDYVVVKGSRGVGLDALTRELRERLDLV
ncbi:MAG: UDP-N-acetylmuramoyl-tripeptide--D-alanyl-D-alanine ligase [Rubrobacter sp.]|nr:UDP-N-acetylmuramoyl-tripeptide--D-alanyl-D-alanine ligase [Rubrobacter sp.]